MLKDILNVFGIRKEMRTMNREDEREVASD